MLIGRGPYAKQENTIKDKSKYGTKRTKDFDAPDSERPIPSYAAYPSDYPNDLFMQHTGQTEEDLQVLNNATVCISSEKMRNSASPEDYDAIRARRNAYEEAMFRIEDERCEVDMAIERNALAMRQIEPIAEEVTMLRENEEKDGQPIGRLQYKLNTRTLNSIQINAVGRIYGDNGDEVIGHLSRNPLAVLPIVYQRLRQKDQEWRKQKSELMTKWKAGCEANYEGSMDFQCYFKRRDLERSLTAEQLRDECQHARSYCSSPEKQAGSNASFGLSSPDRSAVLYEPYAVVDVKPESPAHHTAVRLLVQQVVNSLDKSDQSTRCREMVGRMWMEFMVPFFNYPVHWVQDEVRESFGGRLNNVVVQCKL
jgi:histone deacetylase complex regulatory component SIN3